MLYGHAQKAFEVALTLTGFDLPKKKQKLDIRDIPTFAVQCHLADEHYRIQLTSGVIESIENLWAISLDMARPINKDHLFDRNTKTQFVQISLVWMFLHEMQHYELGHFDILQTASIAEVHPPITFGLTERSKPRPNWFDDLAPNEASKLEPCLEMQADHEAIELLLDAYSADEWPSLRARIASISAMMVLIEREDAKRSQTLSTHPKAATRIFQLLGHVVDMPTIPAIHKMRAAGAEKVNPNDLPSDQDQQAFMREVIIPSIFDAVNLARVAGADSISADLGNADDFFRDIQIAKLGDAEAFPNLTTAGARQWTDLMWFNEKLKPFLHAYNETKLRSR